MVTLPLTATASPLRTDDAGVVRVGSTRVRLETLVGNYQDGKTAEEIVWQYPSLLLADVHAAIAYCLIHQAEVEAYLKDRQKEAVTTRKAVEGMCDQRGVRERLLARQVNRKDHTL